MQDLHSKLPRRERERLRHRQEILDAARRLVADHGIEGLTVEQVARQSEFAIGSIYRHFNSKEELILAVVGDFAEGFFEEVEAVVSEDLPYLLRLERFIHLSLQHQAECQPLFEAFLALPGQLPAPGTEVSERMMGMHHRYLSCLEAIIAAGEAEGLLRTGARRPLALALASLLHGYAKLCFLGDFSTDPAGEVFAFFLDGARARGGVS